MNHFKAFFAAIRENRAAAHALRSAIGVKEPIKQGVGVMGALLVILHKVIS